MGLPSFSVCGSASTLLWRRAEQGCATRTEWESALGFAGRREGKRVWFYVNGQFVEDADAKVSVTDHSFLYGDGCFEGIGVCSGRVLHLDDHVARMFKSARMLRITVPVSEAELRNLILETAARNGMAQSKMGYLRPLLSRGAGPLGVKYS